MSLHCAGAHQILRVVRGIYCPSFENTEEGEGKGAFSHTALLPPFQIPPLAFLANQKRVCRSVSNLCGRERELERGSQTGRGRPLTESPSLEARTELRVNQRRPPLERAAGQT